MSNKKSLGPSSEFEKILLTKYDRNYHQIFKIAEELGWEKWGGWGSSSNGSHYQCFRRGNEYSWIGCAFIERTTYGHALPFLFSDETTDQEIIDFLS